MQPTIQDAMSEVLAAMGFEAMARDVKDEHDTGRLRMYAHVCVKNAQPEKKTALANLFRLHKPALY